VAEYQDDVRQKFSSRPRYALPYSVVGIDLVNDRNRVLSAPQGVPARIIHTENVDAQIEANGDTWLLPKGLAGFAERLLDGSSHRISDLTGTASQLGVSQRELVKLVDQLLAGGLLIVADSSR
jgi:hypothetical protein